MYFHVVIKHVPQCILLSYTEHIRVWNGFKERCNDKDPRMNGYYRSCKPCIQQQYKRCYCFHLSLCKMSDSLKCSFISISFLTTTCVFTLIVVKRIWCKWTCETNQHYTKTQIKVNEQLVVRKDIDVNEHDRLYNITYRLKLK
jgi:hypothetical protein